jgi:hypothetical protein
MKWSEDLKYILGLGVAAAVAGWLVVYQSAWLNLASGGVSDFGGFIHDIGPSSVSGGGGLGSMSPGMTTPTMYA